MAEVVQVASLTGCSTAKALELLAATQNDPDAAIGRFYEQEGRKPEAAPRAPFRLGNAGLAEVHQRAHVQETAAKEDKGMQGDQWRWIEKIEQQALGVDNLLRGLEAAKKKFRDDLFPAKKGAIKGCSGEEHVTEWCRPGEFIANSAGGVRFEGMKASSKNAYMFKDDMIASDVIQGRLKDCWLLGALSIVATRPRLLQERVRFAWVERGLYAVEYFFDGRWITVIVDDMIPCGCDKKPLFGKCYEPHNVWVSIMEKAYAKLMGGYSKLEFGSEDDGLVTLTGGIPKTLDMHVDQNKLIDGTVWNKLLKNQAKGHFMGCANHGVAQAGGNIMKDHAYAILGVYDTRAQGGPMLVHIRNPWGSNEWNGRFSRTSPEWQQLTEAVREFVGYRIWQEKQMGGSFYMCWEDFYTHFDRIYACKMLPKEWNTVTIPECEWKGPSAGGCNNHATLVDNPQFRLIINQPTKLRIRLFQTSRRIKPAESHEDEKNYKKTLKAVEAFQRWNVGLYLVRCPGGADETKSALIALPPENITACTKTFYNTPQVTIKAEVSPAGGEAAFVVIPATYLPGQEGRFSISVSSSAPVVFEKIEKRLRVTSLRGAWDATAGGCFNHSTWRKNPAYLLTIPQDAERVYIVLDVENLTEPPFPGIGIYCFEGKKNARKRGATEMDKTDLLCSSGTFIQGKQARIHMTAVKKGTYLILPTTFRPGEHQGTFKISTSTEPVMRDTLECVYTLASAPALLAAYEEKKTGLFSNVARPSSARQGFVKQPPSVYAPQIGQSHMAAQAVLAQAAYGGGGRTHRSQ